MGFGGLFGVGGVLGLRYNVAISMFMYLKPAGLLYCQF